jgi:SPP1 gp7 family putative phage head morphogenesis protein
MSDNNYWEKRAVDLEKLSQDRADVDIMHVNKLFDGAVDIVEKQIEEIFGKYARDSGISQDAALRLLNEKQTETMRRNLMITLAQCQEEIARQAILARLNAPAYAARISRLEALKDLIHAQAYKVGSAAHYRLTDRLIDTYEQSYYRSIYDQQRRTETGFDFTKLADRDVQAAIATNWAGSNYSNRIWKNTKKLAESLEEIITQGLMTGQSIRDMELALEARVVSERYKINRIIRTEVNHCCNQGTLMSYKAAGTLRYIYLATLDMRTSSICRSLDKEVFFVSKAKVGVNFPPMHPNCRSTTMAYPEDGIFPKERIARDPETNKNIHVPFDMSYAQWYRKYVIEKDDANVSGKEQVSRNKCLLPKGKEYKDVTDNWKESKLDSQNVKELKEYAVNGATYTVDGKNVKLDYSVRERKVADILLNEFGGDISMVPRVLSPQGISTPDYIFRHEGYDLKELLGKSKNVVYNAISKKKRQASNFILDITKSPLENEEIYEQVEKIYWSDHTEFVDKIIIVKDNSAIKVYERIK